MPHRVISFAEQTLGCALRVDGDIGLLERPRRALLVSRGQRHPTPADPGILGTISATRQAVRSNETLVVGTHRDPWDVALLNCRKANGSTIVALADRDAPFDILPNDTLLVWPEKSAQPSSKDERLLQRDRLVGLLASCAYSIQIRPNGNMAGLVDELKARGCSVEDWPVEGRIPTHTHPNSNNPKPETRNPKQPFPFADRLTHFTREPDGLWPNEPRSDYLQWLSSGPQFTPRDAFQSLRRILARKKINACGRLINGATPMVCLTQRDPVELLAENRWRKGLSRWTYSHYALSFRREDLEGIGARGVCYVSGAEIQNCTGAERPFMQIESSGEIDWRTEVEWRVQGDLDFSRIHSANILALVSNVSEAHSIEHEFHIRALAIGSVSP